ncbi:co-chaperone YbbN [Conyzicola nivalis]|uniref:Thioredoxin n=1 Tax=Conyzicola nivalis TaxID=1477021 RepID=A0A916SKI6_9MICO|nr:tetratricopeptide repeat protein [Conyzicola nivalis]GGB00867.1 thioredoxin [Conyzicola nivalis]
MTNLPPSAASLRGAVDLSSLVNPAPPVAAPTGKASSLVVEATDATFSSILELSNSVPVLVEFYGQGLAPSLGALVAEFGGRMVLATIDGTKNPQLVQAFQVSEVPTVAAVIGGRPLQLFVGLPEQEEIRGVLNQVLEVAKQQNITGTVPVDDADADADAAEPVEEPLPPHHQEAFDAISAGDFATAIAEYKLAITQNPRDALAVAGLAQVSLLARLEGTTADEIRAAAASAPDDVHAQLAVADLDISGGHVDDAFLRLLELFPSLDADGKTLVRTRMLEHFEVVGTDDPRVVAARRRLTALLY